MVGVLLPARRNCLFEPLFDRQRCLAGRNAGAVANPEDMGINCDGRLAEGDIEDDIGGIAIYVSGKLSYYVLDGEWIEAIAAEAGSLVKADRNVVEAGHNRCLI